jgi:methyl-accepting chemotaxis protein
MSASTEEVAAASQILSTMTKEMLEEVNKFKI